jgi:AAHS family 4-hydroxybenzoate transporter-like MFS transporter
MTQDAVARKAETLDVGAFMDTRRLGATHLRVFLLCALVALLDGADSQSVGVAAPALAAAVGVKIAAFGPIFSAAQFGAMLGALASGLLADRLGRKALLVANAVLIGLFTLATPFAHELGGLFALRFMAGLGLGGATPCFLALMSDYSPRRDRATLVSLLWAAFPVGATLGGFLNAYLIAQFGWTAIFFVGGSLPLVIALVLALALKESPQFLLTAAKAPQQARRIIETLSSEPLGAEVQLTSSEIRAPGLPLRRLFGDGRALFTPLLWGVFATAFGILTVFVLWTPALLKEQGMAVAQAAIVVAWFNLGAVFGQGAAGRLVDRFGGLAVLAPGLVIGGVCFALVGVPELSSSLRLSLAVGAGVFLGLGSSGAIALAALSYPSQVRSTGIGWGMALGRGGQVVGPLIAGAVLAGGASPRAVFAIMAAAPVAGAILVVLLARGPILRPHPVITRAAAT